MSGIIDLKNFKVTAHTAAWAICYLLQNWPNYAEIIEESDSVIHYVGSGGRRVTHNHGKWSLHGFRRFEYRWLEDCRDKPVEAVVQFRKFHELAKRIKQEEADAG